MFYHVIGLFPNLFDTLCTVYIGTVYAIKSPKLGLLFFDDSGYLLFFECCSQIRPVLWGIPIDPVIAAAAAALADTTFSAAAALAAPR